MTRFLCTIKALAASAAALLTMASCSNTLKVDTPLEDTGVTLEGLGVELDPHFISQNVTREDGATVQDWTDIVVRRVEGMQVQRFRVMLLPRWWEPEEGTYTFDSIEMQSVRAVLDLAQQTGASVTLVLWGCPLGYFMCNPEQQNWVTAPLDDEAFARNFTVVVKKLLDEGYSCIKEVTPFNEPDGDVCEADQYIRIVRAMDRCFRSEGIRDKVRFNLSDNTDGRRYFLKECADSLHEYADIFNSHTYIFGYENPNGKAIRWERRNLKAVAPTGRKHLIGEFGSNLCLSASRQMDINWYKRGVLVARNCLNLLNAGAAGASYWSLIDQYYNQNASYEEMQQLGLWRYKKNAYQGEDGKGCDHDYQVRPQYYVWSLMTRFIRKGDTVRPLDLHDRFAAGSAFLSENGEWTYVFANGSDNDLSFDLCNEKAGGSTLRAYLYKEGELPDGDSLLSPSGSVSPEEGLYKVSLPSQTVLLLTEKQ